MVCLLRGTDWIFPLQHLLTGFYNRDGVFTARYGLNISLYNIYWLVFTTETECVYCAVRAESLYIIKVNINLSLQLTDPPRVITRTPTELR
jgi:hypothetical protein